MSDTKNNFRELKGLLKLKRHEIPPPGYFNQFSGDVVSRIRAGESDNQGFMERVRSEWPFLANVMGLFAIRPGLIGGLATSACLLLVVSVLWADRSESSSTDGTAGIAQAQTAQSVPDANPTFVAQAAPLAPPDAGISISTNPMGSLQPAATLFGSQQNPLFQQAAFMSVSRQ